MFDLKLNKAKNSTQNLNEGHQSLQLDRKDADVRSAKHCIVQGKGNI